MVADLTHWSGMFRVYHRYRLQWVRDTLYHLLLADDIRSFIDALMAVPLGMLLVGVQMLSARNDMFNNV